MKMTLVQFIPVRFFQWCETVWPGNWLREATWGFAVIETIHIMVLAVLLGTIFVVDLRLLGLGLKRRSAAQLARDLMPWTLTSMALMVLTGIPLFMSEAMRLRDSGPFFYKMLFLVLALITHFTIYRSSTQPGKSEGAGLGKVAACVSLACWFGVAMAGRAIAFL
jgi:hypothetical protein